MRKAGSGTSPTKEIDESDIAPNDGINITINADDQSRTIHLDNSCVKLNKNASLPPDTTTIDGIEKPVQKDKNSEFIITTLTKEHSKEDKIPPLADNEEHLKLQNIPFAIRIKFVRKVYILLSLQLLMTIGMSFVSMVTANKGFGHFQLNNPKVLFVFCAFQVLLSCTLLCVRKVSRTVPYNYICLFLFTFSESYMVSAVCAVFSNAASSIILSATMTAGVVVGLTIYAFRTKEDYTAKYALIYGSVFVVAILAISTWVLKFSYAETFINSGCGVLYCLFLIYDTQLVVGKNRHGLHIDDYVLGVVILYTDIIGLFVTILNSVSNSCGSTM